MFNYQSITTHPVKEPIVTSLEYKNINKFHFPYRNDTNVLHKFAVTIAVAVELLTDTSDPYQRRGVTATTARNRRGTGKRGTASGGRGNLSNRGDNF